MSSIIFDKRTRTWTIRQWPHDGVSIAIGSDWTVGSDDNSRTTCLYGVADFLTAGNAAFAVWCRQIFEDRRKPEETVKLYTVEAGNSTVRTPDAAETRTVRRALCRNHQSDLLCRQ